MTEPLLCPQCGSEIPSGAPAGLCPNCLVLAGLESQPGDPKVQPTQPGRQAASAGFVPPSIEQLAAQFPQLEILELLGRGGMGAVYKARQPGLDRLVALKILPKEIGGDPAFAERFTREARALARLSHPNIVVVYDFGRTNSPLAPLGRGAGGEGDRLPSPSGRGAGGEGSLFYFVMEYVDGVNLRQAIQAGEMNPKQALAIVPQICDALQFAHDEGIVHRDIKPENILIDKRGRVKIADFGLAKLLGRETADHGLTGTQQVMGTLRYMAPEQMVGTKAVDHRADIYSLGVVFYELLTGEVPIGRFAPPSKKVEIDVRLDEVVLRALEEKPEQRYQHASDVKSEVEAIRGSALAVAPAPAARASDAVFRRRVTAMTLVGLTLAEAAFLGLQAGYLAGADWYFKQELPYGWLSMLVMVLGAMSGICLVVVWYLLAKTPATPRNFADFFRILQTPDPRAKWFWLPLGVFFAVWMAAELIAMATLGDVAQTVVNSIPFVVGPYVVVAALRWAYPPQRGEAVPRPLAPIAPGSPSAKKPTAAQLEREVLAYLPRLPVGAIGAYRNLAGVSIAEAREAVKAIAAKHGMTLNNPKAIGWNLLGIVLAFAIIAFTAIKVQISALIWMPAVMLCLAVPYTVSAWKYHGLHRGRRDALLAGCWWFVIAVQLLANVSIPPENLLARLYKLTGVTPGRDDAIVMSVIFLAVVAGVLLWLIRYLYLLQIAKRATPPQAPITASSVSADLLPRLTVTVISGVLGCLTMAAGVALAAFAILTESPASGQFWGWMGGAFGCFFGGGGALIGGINSYRQLAGAGDLMAARGWTWFDCILVAYGACGCAALVTALAWAALASPARWSIGLLGAIMVGQAALFLMFRAPFLRSPQPSTTAPTETPDSKEKSK